MGKKVVSKEVAPQKIEEILLSNKMHPKQPKNAQNGIFQIEARRKIVAQKYLSGWTQWEIAHDVGVDQGTIKNDLEALRQMWREKAIQDIGIKTQEELAKIDNIERMATEEYIRSLKAEKTVVQYTETNGDFTKDGTRVVKRGRLGDTRYLDQLQWCIEMRCKILGITKEQQKVQINNLMALDWDGIISENSGKAINDEILQLEGLAVQEPTIVSDDDEVK